ncbi:hypothetical protein AKO1_011548 [Acrasis kona]|uniref:PWI domain-containing protein n=1 Tax=Acrasis kona TaxID=1008807 RepID=A0AAW2Z1F2_9EUKA
MKFPKIYNQKIDFKKIKMQQIHKWIEKRVEELTGTDDDVPVGFIISLLEEQEVDPRNLQVNITGFLEDNTVTFMKELWAILISAMNTEGGIPKEFLEKEKEDQTKSIAEHNRIKEEISKRTAAASRTIAASLKKEDFVSNRDSERSDREDARRSDRRYNRSNEREGYESRRRTHYSDRYNDRRRRSPSPYERERNRRIRRRSPSRSRSRSPRRYSRSRSRSSSRSRSYSRSRSRSRSRSPHYRPSKYRRHIGRSRSRSVSDNSVSPPHRKQTKPKFRSYSRSPSVDSDEERKAERDELRKKVAESMKRNTSKE